ncbi:hypothetical protein CL633_04425 [bacterium]|jgi:hypothetical protein|nr:hypothetical protein [bacterium]|tara:strand:+ start:1417 stop:2016 length:600 start_codon:yes stop_codon:yes gene_type:complete
MGDQWGWRQPIPVKIKDHCGGHKFATTILEKLIILARTEDDYDNENSVFLKRGQVFLKCKKFAEWFGLPKKGAEDKVLRILNFLTKEWKLIRKQKTRDGLIITIIDYDKRVKMRKQIRKRCGNGAETKRKPYYIESGKSDKSDQREGFKTFNDVKKTIRTNKLKPYFNGSQMTYDLKRVQGVDGVWRDFAGKVSDIVLI